jgi:hypothetical protein
LDTHFIQTTLTLKNLFYHASFQILEGDIKEEKNQVAQPSLIKKNRRKGKKKKKKTKE